MIKIRNDEGRLVSVEGPPGSVERLKKERSGLIKLLQRDIDLRIENFARKNSALEVRNLLRAALEKYGLKGGEE